MLQMAIKTKKIFKTSILLYLLFTVMSTKYTAIMFKNIILNGIAVVPSSFKDYNFEVIIVILHKDEIAYLFKFF